MTKEMSKRLLTVDEAANYLGLKISRIRKAVASNEIPFLKVGRLVRFDSIQLESWLEEKAKEFEGGKDD